MRKKYIFQISCTTFMFFLFLVYYSCNNDGDNDVPEPVQLLRNGDMELGISGDSDISGPQRWFDIMDPADGDLDLVWSDDEYYSPSRSLMISTSVSQDSTFGAWVQFINSGIIHNQNINLKVNIKAENLEGLGVAIAIRADNRTQQEVLKFETTEGIIDIKGTFDWKEYSLVMDSVPDQTNGIFVFFIYLNQTTGKVYFDDADLSYDNS